jgi:oligoribonuclease NrnB/cAMP/cGMP phosphodiesterase (DHH superfamily)
VNGKPLVIYHAGCWDGFCAAWVARKALGEIESHAAHYGTEPPDVTGRTVYILDFSYPRAVMRRLLGQAHWVVVLDHHKTAQSELDGLVDEFIQRPDLIASPAGGAELPLIWFDMSKSGARLAWEYFNREHGPSPADVRIPKSPWLVDYTEDRDLWRHALPESENINAALRSYPLDFSLWDEFHESVGQREVFKREGAAIRRRERQVVEEHIRHAREIEMAGHRVLAVNATVMFSEIAGELAKGRPFGACYFDRFDGKRQWSLRSDENGVDVSAIAKALGGGGHVRASGFEEAARLADR